MFMVFTETRLKGAYIIDLERREDERGFFARTWCQDEFTAHGLNAQLMQCNVSFNHRRGTLRGLHYQLAPHDEAKLVRCTMGAIYDVVVDLRPESPSCGEWVAVQLSASNRTSLYIPEGMAHGFQTLKDNSEVFYQMSASYAPQYARGIRWDDPAFKIEWPATETRIMSERDAHYPPWGQLHPDV